MSARKSKKRSAAKKRAKGDVLQKISPYTVEFSGAASQDEEWCVVHFKNGQKEKKIRFHDYHNVYDIPGLYEHIFYDRLKCVSPEEVCSLLDRELEKASVDPASLKALDLGAGNGMVAERLYQMGVRSITGIDIVEEARRAAMRDRPRIYEDYYTADLTKLPAKIHKELNEKRFNCLITVAALGFGDIPTRAFAKAYNLISKPGWIAFNIKELFLGGSDQSGFAGLVGRMFETGLMQLRIQERYQHRLSTAGQPLYYMALIAEKHADIPEMMLKD